MCTSPMRAIQVDGRKQPFIIGKLEYFPDDRIEFYQSLLDRKTILSYVDEAEFEWELGYLTDRQCFKKFEREWFINNNSKLIWKCINVLALPCGNCAECREKRKREWADRIMLEASLYPADYNWFVTLTYNDLFLPYGEPRLELTYDDCTKKYVPVPGDYIDDDGIIYDDFIKPYSAYSPKVVQFPTLVKKHPKSFISKLISYFHYRGFSGVRCYYAGEYGSVNHRPHYHFILFNCPLKQFGNLEQIGSNFQGDPYFKSDIVENCWQGKLPGQSKKSSMGFTSVGEVTWDSARYVAGYIQKKLNGKASSYYTERGIISEFPNMSLKPGIAGAFFEKHVDEIYSNCRDFFLNTPSGAREIGANSYFDKLYDKFHSDNPELLLERKEKRKKLADNHFRLLVKNLSKSKTSLHSFYSARNDELKRKLKSFERKL